jgi:hypothetical protein
MRSLQAYDFIAEGFTLHAERIVQLNIIALPIHSGPKVNDYAAHTPCDHARNKYHSNTTTSINIPLPPARSLPGGDHT